MIKLDKSLPVRRITPACEHHFFGYYDLQPFDINGKYHLTHKTDFRNRLQKRGDTCEVGLIDMSGCKYEKLEITRAWNFQQGAMLQWNPLAPDREIIYNDMVDYQHVGVVMDINTGKKRFLDRAVANVSLDGKYAVCVNMSRMYDFRPGYGYAEPGDHFYHQKHSSEDGVFLMDMQTGKSKLVLSMQEIWDFSGSFFGKDEKMIINHITFNTDASRFLMLVRNFPPAGSPHKTALITANRDGSDMYLLSDYGIQSHYFWMDPTHLVIYNDGKELDCTSAVCNNYILTDKTHEGTLMADGYFYLDNHMSFSPNGKFMVTDTYPQTEHRMQYIQFYSPEKNTLVEVGKFYSLPSVVTDVRCDLHPRFNRCGDMITFDSTHEGFRGIYAIDFPEDVQNTLFDK